MKLNLGRLIGARDLIEQEIAPGCVATAALRSLWPHAAMEKSRAAVETVIFPPVRILAVPDLEMRSDFMAYKGSACAFVAGYFPDYVRRWATAGALTPTVDAPIRLVEEPAICVTHFTLRTYGHFLLEMLPKVLLARSLQEQGLAARIVFPSDAGPMTEIVRHICPDESLLLYRSASERLLLRNSLQIGQLFSGRMNPAFVSLVRSLVPRFGAARTGDRIFLSRERWNGYRKLTNEAELHEVGAAHGFRIVHPQEMSWPDQVRMFAGASHVISAYDSALHGTIFSPSDALIVSLGRVNAFQDGISASLGHRIGYLDPSAGVIAEHNAMSPSPHLFEISPEELAAKLLSLEGA